MAGRFILTVTCFINIYSLAGQEQWTLEKCISHAVEKNIQLKIQELSAENYELSYFKSKMMFLPSLNATGNQSFTKGRSVDAFTNEFAESNSRSNSFSVSGSMTLFNGFQNINTMKQSHLNLLASLEDYQKAKNDLSLNIASAYLQILFSDEMVYIAQKQVELSQQQVDRNRKLFEAGSIAQGNYLDMQSQFASDEMQLVSTQNQLELAYLTLSQLLELGFGESIEIVKPALPDPEVITALPSPEDVYNEALSKLPQIKSAELRLKSAEKGLAIARGYRSPRLSLNGVYSTGYSSQRQIMDDISGVTSYKSGWTDDGAGNILDVYSYYYTYDYFTPSFSDQLRDNNSKSLTFSLTVPIFNNWQANQSASAAKINALNSMYSLESAKKQLQKEIQQAYTDVTAAHKKYLAAKKSVTAGEESFMYVEQRFEVGLVNSVDFNLAKNNMARARSELVKAKYEFVFRMKILDFYRGIPITL